MYSVVVPVYNSSRSLVELHERLRVVFGEMGDPWELILVDDGSRDHSAWSTCQDLARRENVRGVRLARNFGKPAAVLCGIGLARGQWIITIDDDLQQRPEDIPALLRYRDHDVVVANYQDRKHGALAVAASRVTDVFRRTILELPCSMSPLKVFKADVARAMLMIRTPHPFIPALMSQVTDDFHSTTVLHEQSLHGNSRYTFRKKTKQLSNLMISNSSLLLRLLALTGTVLASAGFAYALLVIVRKIAGAPIQPGWSSLIVINLVFGGLTLIGLGIIGEYLIRILDGLSMRPPYVIRELAGAESEESPDTQGGIRLENRD